MNTAPDRFPTLEEQSYRRLLEAILTGEYPPGTKLAGSRLAAELHVSRITVANALKRLTSEGFVVSQPHREAIVATLDESDLHEIFLMRHALEDVVLREAAKRMTPAMLRDLRDIDRRVRQSIEENDVRAYRSHEREFHLAIYAASGLRLIATMLMDLWTRLEPYRGRRHSELGLLIDSLPDREAIIAALERGNGRDAATAMRRHVNRGHARMVEVLRRNSATAGSSERQPGRSSNVPSAPPATGSLVAVLSALPDTRRRQGRMFPIGPVLAVAVLAMLCGESRVAGIARWGQNCHPAIREALGLTSPGGPSVPTMHRVLRQIEPDRLLDAVKTWLHASGIACDHPDVDATGFAAIGSIGERLHREEESGIPEPWASIPVIAICGQSVPESSHMRLAVTELRQIMGNRPV